MSFCPREPYECSNPKVTDDETAQLSEGKQGKQLLTKIWVEEQRVRTDNHSNDKNLPTHNHREQRFHSRCPVSHVQDSDKQTLMGEEGMLHGLIDRKLLQREEVNNANHLTDKWLKNEESSTDDSILTTDLSELALEGPSWRREALKLPLLTKCPLVSPSPSPSASSKAGFYAESDSSPTSSPVTSPLNSPRGKLTKSLARNLALEDRSVKVTRSLPGSPDLQRAMFGQLSDLSHNSTGQASFHARSTLHQSQNNNDIYVRSRSFTDKTSLSANGKFVKRRPGTPITHDLRPGKGVVQFSKSMSNLQEIEEALSERREQRISCRLLPNIAKTS